MEVRKELARQVGGCNFCNRRGQGMCDYDYKYVWEFSSGENLALVVRICDKCLKELKMKAT